MEAPRPAAAAAPAAPTPPVVRKRKRWFLRLLGCAVLFAVALFLATPWLLGLGYVRGRLTQGLSEALGAEVQLDGLAFGWTSGFTLQGLRVANARGFDPGHPALELRQLAGRISFTHLARGRFGIQGKASGLRLWVDQDAAGRVNLQAFGGAPETPPVGRAPAPAEPATDGHGRDPGLHVDGDVGDLLARLRLDLVLDDAAVEIRRDGRLLESLTAVTARVGKEFGGQQLRCDFGAETLRDGAGGQPGRVALHLVLDAKALAVDAALAASGIDLARYQPLATSALHPGDLTALGGRVGGELKVQVQAAGPTQRVRLDGQLQLDEPHFAGALLRGMDVRAARWTARPELDLVLDQDRAPQIQAERFAVDLGFLQLRGLDAAAVRQALGDTPGIGFAGTLDADQLAAFGGDLPPQLRQAGGTVRGTVVLPLGRQLPAPAELLTRLVADAQVQCRRIGAAGLLLTDVDGRAQVKDGKLVLTTQPGAQLNAGGVRLGLQGDLRDLDSVPFDLELDWRGGKVDGEAADVLRYCVPLLAGLDGTAASFRGRVDLGLKLRGPSLRRAGQNWLQVLDQWSGDGHVTLADAALAPAPALQQLLGFLGQQRHLAIDSLDGRFTIAEGAVTSNLTKWMSQGRSYGLSGKVHIDGRVDCRLDLTDVLQQHKDGRKVLELLGNARLSAGLGGDLAAPTLLLPDLGPLLRDAAAAALQQEAQKALEKQGGDLLQKGLEGLLKKKKPQQSPVPPPAPTRPSGG